MLFGDDRPVAVIEHVRELRRRVIVSCLAVAVGTMVGVALYRWYLPWVIAPFGDTLYVTRVEEGFVQRFRLGFYAGLVLSLPVHVYNIVAFIVPALSRWQRRFLGWLLAGALILGVAGGVVAYAQILPLAVRFLQRPEFQPPGVDQLLGFERAVGFFLQVILAFVVLFQLPLVELLLLAMGVVSRRQLLRLGRYVIVALFLVAGILTPPDVISQVGLAVPLILLYYLAIFIAYVLNLGRHDPAREEG